MYAEARLVMEARCIAQEACCAIPTLAFFDSHGRLSQATLKRLSSSLTILHEDLRTARVVEMQALEMLVR